MFKRFFHNKDGKIVLWQTPNLPIIGWALFTLLSRVIHLDALAWIATGFLLLWALLELGWGVNYFRRLLGLIILVGIIWAWLN